MFCLATSPLAPVLGQRVPVRGPARLLNRSYARAGHDVAHATRLVTTSLGDLMQVDLASFQEWQIWAFGSFENHVAELFGYLVHPGDRCIDIGANVGLHAIRLGKLTGPRGEVLAIEPDPEIAWRASANVALNKLANVRIVQAAASSRSGEFVSLYRVSAQNTNQAMGSLYPHPHLTGDPVQVKAITIDEAWQGPVALMKIDVEGHEAAVVHGALEIIQEYRPAVIFEYEPRLLADPSQSPFELLADSGYQVFRICYQRHRLTGRGVLRLERLGARPETGGDLLALPASDVARVSRLVQPA